MIAIDRLNYILPRINSKTLEAWAVTMSGWPSNMGSAEQRTSGTVIVGSCMYVCMFI